MPHKTLEERQAYHRAYRERNKAKLAEQSREYREANADQLKVAKKLDYEKNSDAYKARAKASRERLKDVLKARRSTPEYREHVNAQRRAKYVPHPLVLLTEEEKRERKRQDHLNHKDARNENARAYYQANKHLWEGLWGKLPYWQQKFRRGLTKAYGKGAEVIDIPSIREFYRQVFTQEDAICDYCRGRFPIREIIVEHKNPYCLGGEHAVTNFAVSCNPCNLHKGTTPFEQWTSFATSRRIKESNLNGGKVWQ